MTAADACHSMAAVGYALAMLHEAGIAHGDIRSGTVMLREEGPTLGVLGRPASAAVPFDRVPEPVYVAPELARGGAPTVDGDIYALGVMFHVLLTGFEPRLDQGGRPRPPSIVVPLWDAVERALAQDPRNRALTARQFADYLSALTPHVADGPFGLANPTTRAAPLRTVPPPAAPSPPVRVGVPPVPDELVRPATVATTGRVAGAAATGMSATAKVVIAVMSGVLLTGIAGTIGVMALGGDDSATHTRTAEPTVDAPDDAGATGAPEGARAPVSEIDNGRSAPQYTVKRGGASYLRSGPESGEVEVPGGNISQAWLRDGDVLVANKRKSAARIIDPRDGTTVAASPSEPYVFDTRQGAHHIFGLESRPWRLHTYDLTFAETAVTDLPGGSGRTYDVAVEHDGTTLVPFRDTDGADGVLRIVDNGVSVILRDKHVAGVRVSADGRAVTAQRARRSSDFITGEEQYVDIVTIDVDSGAIGAECAAPKGIRGRDSVYRQDVVAGVLAVVYLRHGKPAEPSTWRCDPSASRTFREVRSLRGTQTRWQNDGDKVSKRRSGAIVWTHEGHSETVETNGFFGHLPGALLPPS